MTTETHPHTSAGMKVLLLENIHSSAHELLEENGFEVESLTGALSEAELCERVRGVQVLGIRSKTLVTPRVIEAGKSLLSVGCFCIGTNQVNLDAAALLADQVLEAADRLGVDDLEIEIEPTLALRQDWTYADLILSNLIENAHRYREAGSLIRITARKRASSAGGIELSVTNRCNPAARIDPDKVFEKYWRDPHATSQRGAGLGLWLSRNAARMLGGDLRCSVRDASISFVLELPDR